MLRTVFKTIAKSRNGQLTFFAFVLMLLSSSAVAQSSGKGSADGTLTVTATVTASATVFIEADGTSVLVVVNAADPKDDVSRLIPAENSTRKYEKAAVQNTQEAGHHK